MNPALSDPPPGTATETEAELIARCLLALRTLWDATGQLEEKFSSTLDQATPEARASARNLIHYLAVRQHDIRPLQKDLARLGLSSLGRMESHVRATLAAVFRALAALSPEPVEVPQVSPDDLSFERGESLLGEHTTTAFGPECAGSATRIMVTMPSEAATDLALVRDLLSEGMAVARINCAHDGPETWQQMIANIRRAEEETGLNCRVAFDVAGPKLRTGPLPASPPVIRWKPLRDTYGRVVTPAHIFFVPAGSHPVISEPGALSVPVSAALFEAMCPGLEIVLKDTRKAKRQVTLESAGEGYCLGLCGHTGYVTPGTGLELREPGRPEPVATGTVEDFESTKPAFLVLTAGQTLIVRKGDAPGHSAIPSQGSAEGVPATISCDLEAVFQDTKPGEPISFDDGTIEGIIRKVEPEQLEVEITRVTSQPAKLRAEKGINLPETNLGISGLTAKDVADLEQAVPLGNLVSLSFVRDVADVRQLIGELDRHQADHLGIILKIETRKGFENLGSLLLEAMRHPPVAVMIARGDLGVELGFERMAEVQEEILWLCEAAHVPVIWATQVLESLAKRGLATRAEVTDAAMGSRAECVMLNKGPHIVRAVKTLASILRRMESHQLKKKATLRKLKVASIGPFETA